MVGIKRAWTAVKEDPKVMQAANGWAAIFWAANFPPVVVCYIFLPDVWKPASILYLALVSIYANFVGHISAWQASRVEVVQARQEKEADEKEAVRDQKLIERIDEITPDA